MDAGLRLGPFANSLGPFNKLLLPRVAINAVSKDLLGAAMGTHNNAFAVLIKLFHVTSREGLEACEGFRPFCLRAPGGDVSFRTLVQVLLVILTCRLADVIQDEIKVTGREVDLVFVVPFGPLANQLTRDIREER